MGVCVLEHMCGPQHIYLSSNLCFKSEKSYDKEYPKGPAFISFEIN